MDDRVDAAVPGIKVRQHSNDLSVVGQVDLYKSDSELSTT